MAILKAVSPIFELQTSSIDRVNYAYAAHFELVGDYLYQPTYSQSFAPGVRPYTLVELVQDTISTSFFSLRFTYPQALNPGDSVTVDPLFFTELGWSVIFDSAVVPVLDTGVTSLVFTVGVDENGLFPVVLPPNATSPPVTAIPLLNPVIPLSENPLADLFLNMEQNRMGEPNELYEFIYGKLDEVGVNRFFRYTSSNALVIKEGETFIPEPIRRDEIQQTTDINRATLSVNVTKNNAIAKMFVPGTPPYPFFLRIFKAYVKPNSTVAEFMTIFSGRISSCSFSGMEVRFTCDPIYSSVKRQGIRRRYESACPHNLYSPACGVNKESLDRHITVTNAVLDEFGSTITIPSGTGDGGFNDTTRKEETRDTLSGLIQVDVVEEKNTNNEVTNFKVEAKTGYYTGGMVKLGDGSFNFISRHEKNKIVLWRHIVMDQETKDLILKPNSTELLPIILYPGCDRTPTTCKDKFNNMVNYGGFPYFPDTNPFVGTHVPQGG